MRKLSEIESSKPAALTKEDDQLMADLEKYRKIALDMGAVEARIMPSSFLVQGIRTRFAGCFFPRCLSQGLSMWCPPTWETPCEVAQAVTGSYRYAIVFRYFDAVGIATGPSAGSSRTGNLEYYSKVYGKDWGPEAEKYWREYAEKNFESRPDVSYRQITATIEAEARKDGPPFAFYTAAGCFADKECGPLGSVCIGLKSSMCRFPGRTRPDGAGAMYYDWLRTLPKSLPGWKYTNVGWSMLPKDIEGREPQPGRVCVVWIE